MAFTLSPINVNDAVSTSTPMAAYNDGTNNAFAHAVLDSTGALISPATSGKQDTANTALTAIQASVANIPASPATAANQATANSSLATIATNTTGAATAANQSTANSSLSTVATNTGNVDTNLGAKADTAATSDTGTFSLIALVKRALQNWTTLLARIPALGSAAGAASVPVVIASDQAALPVTQSANNSGGTSTYAALGGTGNALLTNSPVAVKASAGNLYGMDFVNTGAADAYVQIFDVAAGSVTLGTSVPTMAKWVPAHGAWEEKFTGEAKVSFATAITVAATTTPTGNTAPSTGIMANIAYK